MTLVKKYIEDKDGNRVLPITHTSAVKDDNGTPLSTLLAGYGAPDEEDLTLTNGVVKFKDKAYNSASYSGMGRKTLRKNMVSGVNTLTQSIMQATNTIYVIQYDFTLGEDITVPANCVLEFDGGSINGNGTNILTLSGSSIEGYPKFNNVKFAGTINNDQFILNWINISDITSSNIGILNSLLSVLVASGCKLLIDDSITVSYQITLIRGTVIKGIGTPTITCNVSNPFIVNTRVNISDIRFYNNTICNDEDAILTFRADADYSGSLESVVSNCSFTSIRNNNQVMGCALKYYADGTERYTGYVASKILEDIAIDRFKNGILFKVVGKTSEERSGGWINHTIIERIYFTKCEHGFNISGDEGREINFMIINNCAFQCDTETKEFIIANGVTYLFVNDTKYWDPGRTTYNEFNFTSTCKYIYIDYADTYKYTYSDPDNNMAIGGDTIFINNVKEPRLEGLIAQERLKSTTTPITIKEWKTIPCGTYYVYGNYPAIGLNLDTGGLLVVEAEYGGSEMALARGKKYTITACIHRTDRKPMFTTYSMSISSGINENTNVKDCWSVEQTINSDTTSQILYYGKSGQYPGPIRTRGELLIGMCIFDKDNNKPVWWTGDKWVYADGTELVQ